MKGENEALSVCQIINFMEKDHVIFGCREPIKYKIILMGEEAVSCQRHYEFMKSEVEKHGMSEMIEVIEINDNKSKKS